MHLRKLVPIEDLIAGAARCDRCARCDRVHKVRVYECARCVRCDQVRRVALAFGALAALRRADASRHRTCRTDAHRAHPSHRHPAHLRTERTCRTCAPGGTCVARASDLKDVFPVRVKVGEGLLLQHRRRAGVPGRRDAGAHHLPVPAEPEGAEAAVRGRAARGSKASPRKSLALRFRCTSSVVEAPAAARRSRGGPPRAAAPAAKACVRRRARQEAMADPGRAGAVRNLSGREIRSRRDLTTDT